MLIYGSLAKKEKEKSKRKEENGDRKINTLISEKASSPGLPLFFESLISLSWSISRHFPAWFDRNYVTTTPGGGWRFKRVYSSRSWIKALCHLQLYERTILFVNTIFDSWKGANLLTLLNRNIFLLCIEVSLFSSRFTSLFKSDAETDIEHAIPSCCRVGIRLSLLNLRL